MTPASDPYRILGLEAGATPAEIKRAYRRLAKAYHPDSAGERALPNFLAIQAAYERLTADRPQPGGAGRGQPAGRGPAAGRSSSEGPTAPPPGRSWAADPARARATREAYRARTNRSAPRAGASPGAPGGSGPRAGTAGAGPAGGAGADPAGSPRSAPTGRGGGRRARPKATIGSTSYDGTENEPFEPGWSGATWYGAASGTYWTINPKEYADPRKHGPEYLARARRGGAPGSTRAAAGSDATRPGPAAADEVRATDDARGPADERAFEGPAPSGEPVPSAEVPRQGRPEPEPPVEPRSGSRPVRTVEAASRPASAPPAAGPVAGGAPAATMPARPAITLGVLDPVRIVRSWRGRIVLAALAWFPIGLAIFGIHGQLTGCAQYLASCTEPVAWSVWIPQLIAFGLLLWSPRLSWIAASGTMVLIAVVVPIAAILTTGSGGRPPSTDTTDLLLGAMAAGWLAGIAVALSGRLALPPWRATRVR